MADRPDPHPRRSPEFLAEVARAYWERDLTQAQIARQLDISRSQVSRYLQAARDEGIVQIRVVGPETRVTELEKALVERFSHLRDAVVVPAFTTDEVVIRSAVARAAATTIERLVSPGDTVCFGAGHTLAATVQMLASQRVDGVQIVQAMGNAGHEGLDIDYNAIAHTAARAFGGRAIQINAPAVLGSGTDAASLERSNASIHDALELARNAAVYVFGVGSLAGDLLYARTGLISLADLEELAQAGAVGDICANFFDLRGRSTPGPLAGRTVGITLDVLRAAPVTVACAAGPSKVAALTGALTGRLTNVLVTDEHAARGVLALVGTDPRIAKTDASMKAGGHN